MVRSLKPYEVSKFKFQDKTRCIIYLDRDTKDFFAEVNGETVKASSEGECKTAAYKKWKETTNIEWRKVIIVNTQRDSFLPYHHSEAIMLLYDIHEIGQASNDTWFEHKTFGGREDIQSPYYGDTETDKAKGIFILPWSAELEASLVGIVKTIVEVKRKLDDLLGADDAVKKLLRGSGVVKALSAWNK